MLVLSFVCDWIWVVIFNILVCVVLFWLLFLVFGFYESSIVDMFCFLGFGFVYMFRVFGDNVKVYVGDGDWFKIY